MLLRWIRRLAPATPNTRPSEWSRAAIGVSLATLASVWLCGELFGVQVALHLIGPLGASAVLLFAVSSGALAQPWSIIGSYLCATLIAVLLVKLLGRTLASACLAVGLALLLMCLLRCLHPPAGALTLVLVFADPSTAAMGWSVLEPVMLGAVSLLLLALLYNNLTRVRYPRAAGQTPPIEVPADSPGITREDLQLALAELDEFIDVTPQDLSQLINACEAHARRRSIGAVFSGQA